MTAARVLTFGVAGLVAVGVATGGIAYAATNGDATATCQPSPSVTYGPDGGTFTQTCSVPVPTTTETATQTVPGPTETTTETTTATVTQTVTASPSSSSSTSPSPTSTEPSPTSTTPQPPPAAQLVVGARAKDTTNAVMEQTIGLVKAERWFSPGSGVLPAKFTRNYAGDSIPADVDVWASWNSASDADLTSYVKSADPGTKMVAHHEPEGDFPNGAAYVSWFDHERAVIKAADPNMPVVHAAAAYGYRNNGEGADCSYVPKDADIYTIDTYRRTAADMVPLAQDDRFQTWLACLPKGATIGITEYGRGLIGEGASTDALRAANIPKDAAYLRSNPGGHPAVVWMYWWTSGSAGNWRFTDRASIDAWRSVANGN